MSASVMSTVVVLSLSFISLSEGAQTNPLMANYQKAVGLMSIGIQSVSEKRDNAAWGEYVNARRIFCDIQRSDSGFLRRPISSSIKTCEKAIEQLSSILPEKERQLFSSGKDILAKIDKEYDQGNNMLVITQDIKDYLKLVESKEVEPLPEEEKADPVLVELDDDGDGLSNTEEASLETDPLSSDTDNDGLSDFEEARKYGTDPLVMDTDQDGLTDGFEVKTFKTDPLNPDCDSEGLLDGDEYRYGTDPHNPDTDGDDAEIRDRYGCGGNDRDEIDGGYDPLTHIDEQ